MSISDHLAQFLIIPVEYNKRSKHHSKYKRDTKNFDEESFILDILDVNWKETIKTENNDPNFSFNEFENKVNSIIDKHIPLRKLTKQEIKQHFKPWITLGIRNSIKRRDTLHRKFTETNDKDVKNDYLVKYKKLRN